MSKKVIITYSLRKVKKPLKITRKIYGYTEYSNYSKYRYDRPGILTDIEYVKLFRACVMINKKDAEHVVEEFKKLEIKMKILYIDLEEMFEF